MNNTENKLTLAEVVTRLEDLDNDLVIYITAGSDWNESSDVVVTVEPDDGSIPANAEGMEYFLEVSVAKNVLDVWQQWRGDREPTLADKCKAIVHYAMNDAYLPT